MVSNLFVAHWSCENVQRYGKFLKYIMVSVWCLCHVKAPTSWYHTFSCPLGLFWEEIDWWHSQLSKHSQVLIKLNLNIGRQKIKLRRYMSPSWLYSVWQSLNTNNNYPKCYCLSPFIIIGFISRRNAQCLSQETETIITCLSVWKKLCVKWLFPYLWLVNCHHSCAAIGRNCQLNHPKTCLR